jgi:hypothetical protein
MRKVFILRTEKCVNDILTNLGVKIVKNYYMHFVRCLIISCGKNVTYFMKAAAPYILVRCLLASDPFQLSSPCK